MTTVSAPPRPAPASVPRRRWYRRPWVVPAMLIVVSFVAFSLPPYLTFDPDQARIQPLPDAAFYYPALVIHVVCGSIAIITCCFQIWPRFRARHRIGHRLTGRVYAVAGVLPGGLAALYIGWNTPYGPTARVSTLMMGSLWLGVTIAGIAAARRRDFTAHRRWMIRSYALTMSIVINRMVGVPVAISLASANDLAAGSPELAGMTASITTWFGWTSALLIAQWWLDRTARVRVSGPVA